MSGGLSRRLLGDRRPRVQTDAALARP